MTPMVVRQSWWSVSAVVAVSVIAVMLGGCERTTCPAPDRGTTEITGDVVLRSGEDLAGMEGIRRINGHLNIFGSSIETLAGLDQLQIVTGTIRLDYIPKLQHLDNLRGLRSVGKLDIEHAFRLRSLTGLRNLEECEEFKLFNCDSLTTLGNLPVYRITERIRLQGLPALADLTPLANASRLTFLLLENLAPEVSLEPVFSLPNLERLEIHRLETTTVPGTANLPALSYISLWDLPRLTSLNGIADGPGLAEVFIYGCPLVTSLQGFGATSQLSSLSLWECTGLTSLADAGDLSGLHQLAVRDCGVTTLTALDEIPELESLTVEACPVSDLSFIGPGVPLRWLYLAELPAFTDLTSLPETRTFRTVHLTDCTHLTSVAGLHLTEDSRLVVDNCPRLVSLEVPENLTNLELTGPGPTLVDLGGRVSLEELNLYRSSLVDLSDFAGLQRVDNLFVQSNPYLVDATGLGDITSAVRVVISDNRYLDQCELEAMTADWEIEYKITIEDNGPCAP
ncbi:MAG: hypothetical protein DRQ48_10895 [Gammaproteobacteria bacterium]|nr:MAG: hypothetical protein DRQ48_10895 [Gammaproteobacteria bacterium]